MESLLNHEYPHYVVVALYAYYWHEELGIPKHDATFALLRAGHSMCLELTDETKNRVKDLIRKRYKDL